MPALTLRAKPATTKSTAWQCADSPTGAHYWLMDVYTGRCKYCPAEKTWLPEGVEPKATVARILNREHKAVEKPPKPTDGLKACAMCGTPKPTSEYPIYGKIRRKQMPYCRACCKVRDKARYAARKQAEPEKKRQAEDIMRGLRG